VLTSISRSLMLTCTTPGTGPSFIALPTGAARRRSGRKMNVRVRPGVFTVVAASEADDSASTWLRSHRLPLVGYVLPLVNGDVQAAEDVVQETMLRGWQHAGELNPEHAGAWLHAVAHNIAISAYHRRRRSRPPEVPLDENTVPVTDDGLDRMFNAWLVAKALNSISPGHRAVIVELFYQRRPVAEVAALLGIPEGTVRSRCFYGLRALRAQIEKQGITRP
jgi:RNA polymerase sigma-70 factor, ECF subfamily